MIASERICSDINRNIGFGEQNWDLKLVFREWIDTVVDHPEYEFRCFVHNRKLNAITSYFSFLHFPQLEKEKLDIQKLILSTFESGVKQKLDHESYVVDFFAMPSKNDRPSQVYLIELNPFHIKAGACLFDWKTDRSLFLNGPLEMRIVEAPLSNSIEMLPQNLVMLANETFSSKKLTCTLF